MSQEIDQRCIWLSQYLDCDAELVQTAYKISGAINALDAQDNAQLRLDTEKLQSAEKYLQKTVTELHRISENEKLTQTLLNNNITKEAEDLLSKLSEIVNSREFLAKENTAKGGKNIKAHKIAYMVLHIFLERGWNIRYVVCSNTGEPTTNFGKAVQRALELFDTKSTRSESTDYANWQAPTLKIYREYRVSVTK